MSEELILREEIEKAHKSNRFWMILFPIILISLAVITLVVWLAVKGEIGSADTANLAGVAVVLLALPFFLICLIVLALLIGLSFGVFKLSELTPRTGKAIRGYLSTGKHYLLVAEDATAKPVFALRGLDARIKQIRTSLTDRFSQKG